MSRSEAWGVGMGTILLNVQRNEVVYKGRGQGGKGKKSSEGSIAGANPKDQECRGPPPEQYKC